MLGYTGEYNRILNEIEQENTPKQVEPVEPPYYIDLELKALREQIKVNDEIIQEYRWKEELALQDEKKLYWKKKRIDLEYKQSQLDKKQFKLIEKYKLEE
jgi:hypothetical protein